MLKIAICDDDKIYVEKIEKIVSGFLKEKGEICNVNTFTDATELLQSNLIGYDLAILDVEIGKDNGIEVAREIKKQNKDIILIYISSYLQYAPDGYNVKAFAYILKESLGSMLLETMQNFLNETDIRNSRFEYINGTDRISIKYNDIIYFEAFDKVVEIKSNQGDFEIRRKIGDLENELESKGFIRAHKSYLINIDYIKDIRNYIVTLTTGEIMGVSQKRWKEVVKKYMEWKSRLC